MPTYACPICIHLRSSAFICGSFYLPSLCPLCALWLDAFAWRSLRAPAQLPHDPHYPGHHARRSLVIDRLRRIRRLVVVREAERGRVGDHDRGVADLPEGPVVGPADAGDVGAGGAAFARELSVTTERR